MVLPRRFFAGCMPLQAHLVHPGCEVETGRGSRLHQREFQPTRQQVIFRKKWNRTLTWEWVGRIPPFFSTSTDSHRQKVERI